MKRWFLGIFLMLFASVSMLLSQAALAESTGAGCPSDDGNHDGCIILEVHLDPAPAANATVHVHRESPTGQDDDFDLKAENVQNYTSVNKVSGTRSDPGSPCNVIGQSHDTNPTLWFDITVKDSAGKDIGGQSHVDLCRDSTMTSNVIFLPLTIVDPGGGGGGGSGPGGVKGSVKVQVSQGDIRPCPNTVLSIRGPSNKTISTDDKGLFNSGLILDAGDYTLSGICSLGLNIQYAVHGKGTVKAGQYLTLDIMADNPNGGDTEPDIPPDPPVMCNAGPGLTWLICGLIRTLVNVIDWIRDTVIVPFLAEKPLDKADPSVAPIYAAWSAFRNVASVFFIVIFFLIIFGTAIGWDNYTVKKSLPRLVAAAVFIPFSWYLCVVLLDIGNILGQGIVALASSVIPTVAVDFQSNLSKIFLGGALVGVAVASTALASVGMGIIVSVFLAFFSVFLTLVMRKILIITLIILSPFAFLMWILPNTEKWFKEWWSNLFKLVMMYPIVMALFEAGRLFAATAGATADNTLGHAVVPLFQIVGLSLPLFGVPFAFAWAGKALTASQAGIGKAVGAIDKKYGKDSQSAKDRAEQRRANNVLRATDPSNPAGSKTLGAIKRGVALKRSGLGGFTGYSKIPGLRLNAAQKQRINAAEKEAISDDAESRAADKMRENMPESATQRVTNATAAAYKKAYQARVAEVAATVKRTTSPDHDGEALREVPLDDDGVAWLKEQVRTGDDLVRSAALGRLAGSAKGEKAIAELRTGKKIVDNNGVLTRVDEHEGEEYTNAQGVKVKASTGFKGLGGDDDNIVAAGNKSMWDAGMSGASAPHLKKALSAAAKDMKPEDAAKLSVYDTQQYLEYYQRNVSELSSKLGSTPTGTDEYVRTEKKLKDVKKAAAQFDASIHTALTQPNLTGRMYPETIALLASAGAAGNPGLSPSTARIAANQDAITNPPQRIVLEAVSQQVFAASGGDMVKASEIQAHLAKNRDVNSALEQKILQGQAIEAADLASIPTSGKVSSMPAPVQAAIAKQHEKDLDQLAATTRAYEANLDNYRDRVNEAHLAGSKPPPPPKPS